MQNAHAVIPPTAEFRGKSKMGFFDALASLFSSSPDDSEEDSDDDGDDFEAIAAQENSRAIWQMLFGDSDEMDFLDSDELWEEG
ncbi:MAG: hypothetical protein V4525_10380 [Pseudomonadota bacterium]